MELPTATAGSTGKLAFLFPGEGSQYPSMLADLAMCFDEVQSWLDFWHGLYDLPSATRAPTLRIRPQKSRASAASSSNSSCRHGCGIGSGVRRRHGDACLAGLARGPAGRDARPQLGRIGGAQRIGRQSGHHAAQQAACISRHFAVYEELLGAGKIPTGALLAVGALASETVEKQIASIDGVVVAMDNCSNQIVLYGPSKSISQVQSILGKLGGVCLPLPFDRGYHTAAFADVSAAFLDYYKEIKLGTPKVPLYSCSSVGLFPDRAAGVRKLAAAQWSAKVRFRETIGKMHDDGVALFVEVGPSANLTAFVQDILADREFIALSTNVRQSNDVEQFLNTLAQLYVAGRGPIMEKLYAPRAIAAIDLDGNAAAPRGTLIDNTMPMIRLSPAERDAIRLIAGRGAAPPAAVLASIPATDSAPAAAASSVPHEDERSDDGRGQVMDEYLDVMRSFLGQQQSFVEHWLRASPPTLDDEAAPASWGHATDSLAPLLDTVLEHDAAHLVAQSNVSLAHHNFVRDHVMTGPVSDTDPQLLGLSCIPLAVSMELMAEACALLAGRTDLRGDRERSRLRLDCARR